MRFVDRFYLSGSDKCFELMYEFNDSGTHKAMLKCKTCGMVFSRTKNNLNHGNHFVCPHCSTSTHVIYLYGYDSFDEMVCGLYKGGKTSAEVARLLHISNRKICRILHENGLTNGRGGAQLEKLDIKRLCNECGKEYTVRQFGQRYCSKRCLDRVNKRRRRAMKYENGYTEPISIGNVIKRDGSRCWICGVDTDSDDFTVDDNGYIKTGNRYPSIDHVIPLSKGGTHTYDNVKIACRMCNSKKGSKIIPQSNLGR